MTTLRVGLAGATGRMGAALQRVLAEDAAYAVAARYARGDELDAFVAGCDVVVDFSRPDLLAPLAAACGAARRPLVSGTTGLDEAAWRVLQAAAKLAPVVHAANFSVGVTLLRHLVARASESLDADWQCEIFDAHHAGKADAPSGTALALGAVVGRAVEYASEREGDTIGYHEVRFHGAGESLLLGHEALDRAIFARGALRAARWAVSRPAGLYGMDDVLALKSR